MEPVPVQVSCTYSRTVSVSHEAQKVRNTGNWSLGMRLCTGYMYLQRYANSTRDFIYSSKVLSDAYYTRILSFYIIGKLSLSVHCYVYTCIMQYIRRYTMRERILLRYMCK